MMACAMTRIDCRVRRRFPTLSEHRIRNTKTHIQNRNTTIGRRAVLLLLLVLLSLHMISMYNGAATTTRISFTTNRVASTCNARRVPLSSMPTNLCSFAIIARRIRTTAHIICAQHVRCSRDHKTLRCFRIVTSTSRFVFCSWPTMELRSLSCGDSGWQRTPRWRPRLASACNATTTRRSSMVASLQKSIASMCNGRPSGAN
mmetsp:Transcript_35361/g.57883  ORF Transcript_35361/g.57883 Transcript_35361/m.57883 type:complete len:202 (+) Transcript_35361:833-1438(+)